MYDIIGDIHGHADELVELLTALGYSDSEDGFRHPERRAVFCGDFIDRGPHIPTVVDIVRTMVRHESAFAVMGNHEFNALAYHVQHPDIPGTFLRPHNHRNEHQHAQTLQQFQPRELQNALEWFATLPPALDFGSFRVVHACWDAGAISTIENAQSNYGTLSPDFLLPATTPDDPVFEAVETVLKGPELALPDGTTVKDKEGNTRRRIRIRWFDSPTGQTWRSYSLPAKPSLSEQPVPASAPAVPYPDNAPPVFMGHYWLPDSNPSPLRHNVACLDYSVAKHGMLCAYRFDNESRLSREKFVTVRSRTGESQS